MYYNDGCIGDCEGSAEEEMEEDSGRIRMQTSPNSRHCGLKCQSSSICLFV